MEFIDLRSDTVTEPTEEMLDSMRYARTGDDVYGDDPTVNELEEKSAALLGKEASVFVPSGTFGNQLAILTHTNRGEEVIIPGDNHIVLYEVGASAVIAGVQLRLLKNSNGFIDIAELEELYRIPDIHYPETGLICLENAHTQGTAVPVENIEKANRFARSKEIPMHLDGARIFNAAISLKVKPSDIAVFFDSVMFCFSKGLCAPAGSILAGSKEFIRRARKNRKLMGGGMRQAGYLAAPCIISIEKMIQRLENDNNNAKYLAKRLENLKIFEIFYDRLDINMVFFRLENDIFKKPKFSEDKFIKYLYNKKIKINASHNNEFRFVTHYYIGKAEIDFVIGMISDYLERN